jgi:hypothetical protein
MLHKKIEEFIKNTGEGVVLDYINGQFVLESKCFAEGKPNTIIKIKAMGANLNNCVDNFVYQLEQMEYNKSNNNEDDIESYRWYCSY